MDKYNSPSVSSSLTLCLWPCLWESKSREVRDSAVQGQTSPCRCFRAVSRTGVTNPAVGTAWNNADVVWYLALQRCLCVMYCYSRSGVLHRVNETSAFAVSFQC